jgi:predicted amidohydrolase YtcJ
MVKYNIFLPINLRRALAIEPDNCRQNYVEACFKAIGPVKTLLDRGVKVVGEFEIGDPTPETYYDILDVYVNREIAKGMDTEKTAPEVYGQGEVYAPEEGVDRIVALKLFTYRSAEFLMAETRIGSLEVGKYADFVVTDRPYLSGPDREIRNNKTVMTVLAGETRYKDPEYNPVRR